MLNISRDNMAATGFSPATRVFEAAGAGACLLTDAWEGIELFLMPDKEVLVVRDGADVVEAISVLDPCCGPRRLGRQRCIAFLPNTPTAVELPR